MTSEYTWRIRDHRLPSFLQDDEGHDVVITSERSLAAELIKSSTADPHVVAMRRSDGLRLVVGIGGPWMFIRLYPTAQNSHALICLHPSPSAITPLSFAYEGQPHVIPSKYLLPIDAAMDTILRFYTTGAVTAAFVSEYKERLDGWNA